MKMNNLKDVLKYLEHCRQNTNEPMHLPEMIWTAFVDIQEWQNKMEDRIADLEQRLIDSSEITLKNPTKKKKT